jgi:hypothetical protein
MRPHRRRSWCRPLACRRGQARCSSRRLADKTLTFQHAGHHADGGPGHADFRTTDAALGIYQTTSTTNVHGILGPWATFNGNRVRDG